MNQTLISLVVPVYNAGEWLAPCLESIAAQSHPAWECLLVDDGSTDGSAALCDAWAARDGRFRALRQPNQGPAAARQAGLARAKGEYVAFVDGDDWLPPDYLARLLALARDHSAQAATCGICRFSGERPGPVYGRARERTLSGEDARRALLRSDPLVTWSLCTKLYHRSLFEGYALPAQVRHNEDLLANWQLLARCGRVAATDWPGYGYRQREDSASHRLPGPAQMEDHLAVADAILADAAGAPLARAAWAFHYEKLLFIDSMVLRQSGGEAFAALHSRVRAALRAGFGRALVCPELALWLKASALLTLAARPLYRALCRRLLPGGR